MKSLPAVVFASIGLLLAGAVFQSGFARFAHATEGCSAAGLQGEYLVSGGAVARSDQPDADTYPRANLALWTFDGKGGLTSFAIQNFGGEIRRAEDTGTYTVDSARCIVSATFPPSVFEIIFTRDFQEGSSLRVDLNENGRATGGIASRQLKKR